MQQYCDNKNVTKEIYKLTSTSSLKEFYGKPSKNVGYI